VGDEECGADSIIAQFFGKFRIVDFLHIEKAHRKSFHKQKGHIQTIERNVYKFDMFLLISHSNRSNRCRYESMSLHITVTLHDPPAILNNEKS
jgi:hypothetical protein